jgi:hypothetical protein
MRSHPEHQLLPVERLPIYRTMRTLTGEMVPDLVRARLGMLTARRVLPLWQAAMPLYPPDNEPGPAAEDLPDYFLGLAQQALQSGADLEAIRTELGTYWYVVGNIELEIFEAREVTDGPLFYAYYALDAAYLALQETMGRELLGRFHGWERMTDDVLPRSACDAASSAVIASSGGGEDPYGPPIDRVKRRAFWEWWLGEALPMAWNEASDEAGVPRSSR